MSRPPTYQTAEEVLAAQRAKQQRYYQKNRETINARTLWRYHAKCKLDPVEMERRREEARLTYHETVKPNPERYEAHKQKNIAIKRRQRQAERAQEAS